MLLFIFEGLGTSELILILVVALVIFGPRKLPQLSRSIGRSLADFKRASEDFKETWQKEVDRENIFKDPAIGEPVLHEDRSILGENRTAAVLSAGEDIHPVDSNATSVSSSQSDDDAADEGDVTIASANTLDTPATRKRDWL